MTNIKGKQQSLENGMTNIKDKHVSDLLSFVKFVLQKVLIRMLNL